MSEDFGGKPWSYIHHLSVLSASVVNEPDEIMFWFEHEPEGEYWEMTKPLVTLMPIKAPQSIYGNPLLHPAHQADIVRLDALNAYGGVYLDADVICLRPFAELEHCGFFMGWQGNYGLCNATMGGDADAPFVNRWLDSYETFRSHGRDRWWDEHSVRIPRRLAEQHPTEITAFDSYTFFNPLWGEIENIFKPCDKSYLTQSVTVHLWETFSWPWLSQLETIQDDCELGRRLREAGVL
ncbi:hypothetical protein HED60_19435 [Planctomycetales bacterium ZRK34]|nr:hypothetical protein HED60_19435 [Planctomycetales bacterium ZRK34]